MEIMKFYGSNIANGVVQEDVFDKMKDAAGSERSSAGSGGEPTSSRVSAARGFPRSPLTPVQQLTAQRAAPPPPPQKPGQQPVRPVSFRASENTRDVA